MACLKQMATSTAGHRSPVTLFSAIRCIAKRLAEGFLFLVHSILMYCLFLTGWPSILSLLALRTTRARLRTYLYGSPRKRAGTSTVSMVHLACGR